MDWIGTCAWLVDIGVGLQEAKFNRDADFRVGAYFFGECSRCTGLDWRVVRSYISSVGVIQHPVVRCTKWIQRVLRAYCGGREDGLVYGWLAGGTVAAKGGRGVRDDGAHTCIDIRSRRARC